MNMKIRNYHARLCEKYVEKFHPEDYQALSQAAEDNYKTGKPLYTLAWVFSLFLASKQPKETVQ